MKQFFDQTEVLSVLHGFNPWWSGKSYACPGFRRLAFEPCRNYLEDTSLRRAVLLSGPRRVGKTTILLQIADYLIKKGHDPKGVFYISFDHPMIKLLSLQKILALYNDSRVHSQFFVNYLTTRRIFSNFLFLILSWSSLLYFSTILS